MQKSTLGERQWTAVFESYDRAQKKQEYYEIHHKYPKPKTTLMLCLRRWGICSLCWPYHAADIDVAVVKGARPANMHEDKLKKVVEDSQKVQDDLKAAKKRR